MVLVGLVGGGACTGQITDPALQFCETARPGKSPMRRLTRFEYNNTVRDLLGDTARPADRFAPDEESLGFDNNATVLGVTPVLAEQYMVAAEELSAAADLSALVTCDPAALGDEPCARQFIEQVGLRAYRRPLAAADIDRLLGVFLWGLEQHGFDTGIRLTLQAMLQSPHFLYRVELALAPEDGGKVAPLSDYEMASRLSYLLWGSMPDDALFAAAAAGELSTREQVRAQAERMLADPRARDAMRHFYRQWLLLEDVEVLEKDAEIYPQWSAAVPALLATETETFVDALIWDEAADAVAGGDVATLLTADYTYMNAELAAFYGIETGPAGDAWERVALDPTRASGVLTHGAVLAHNAKPNQSSPIHRGKFVREQLLCMPLPPPPDNIAIVPPDLDPNLTTRERYSEHSENPVCSGCHELMDPIGFGFESFDGAGLWRDDENGLPIDDSGELIATDVDGPFFGVPELGRKLAASEQVHACVVTQYFRYAYGRAEGDQDSCTITSLNQDFAAAGYDLQSLLIAVTQTDAFMYRMTEVAQ